MLKEEATISYSYVSRLSLRFKLFFLSHTLCDKLSIIPKEVVKK
jgi:hypothetical protein